MNEDSSTPTKRRKVVFVATFLSVSFLVLALLVETVAFTGLRLLRPDYPSDWLFGALVNRPDISDPCMEMISHTILPQVHKHEDTCDILRGSADGGFVEYHSEKPTAEESELLVTLGGSTTDGFYQHYSDGRTWPLQLQERLDEESLSVRVINGGVGAYGSSQEILKLLTEVSFFNPSPTVVVSLSGINDVGREGGLGYMEAFPAYSPSQVEMFCRQQWIRKDAVDQVLLPSTIRILGRAAAAFEENSPGILDEDCLTNVRSQWVTYDSGPGRWSRNIDVANAAASGMGATYVQFLQPTLGLHHVLPPAEGSNDFDLMLGLDEAFLVRLNQDYVEMRAACAKRDFCVDITAVLEGSTALYSDAAHPNAQGNALIADAIFHSLERRGLLSTR